MKATDRAPDRRAILAAYLIVSYAVPTMRSPGRTFGRGKRAVLRTATSPSKANQGMVLVERTRR